jgi:hypothetical protein
MAAAKVTSAISVAIKRQQRQEQSLALPSHLLSKWFQAIFLIAHAKNGISALGLDRRISVSHPTSWKIKHKLMEAMKGRDGQYFLRGMIHIDDASFGGELNGGKAG